MRKIVVLLAILTVFLISGCAGMMSSLPKQDELSRVNGMTKEAIAQKFGEPTEKSEDGNTWDYKVPSHHIYNNIIIFGTFGILRGDHLPMVDIARVKFRHNKVISTEIIMNTMNVNRSEVRLVTEYLGEVNTKKVLDQMPTEMNGVRQEVEAVRPSSNITSNQAPVPIIVSTAKGTASVTITDYKKFISCSIKTARSKLCSDAKGQGMRIEDLKGRIVIITPDGNKIKTSFKQVKKDVLVELSVTGAFTDTRLANDLCRILNTCQ